MQLADAHFTLIWAFAVLHLDAPGLSDFTHLFEAYVNLSKAN